MTAASSHRPGIGRVPRLLLQPATSPLRGPTIRRQERPHERPKYATNADLHARPPRPRAPDAPGRLVARVPGNRRDVRAGFPSPSPRPKEGHDPLADRPGRRIRAGQTDRKAGAGGLLGRLVPALRGDEALD